MATTIAQCDRNLESVDMSSLGCEPISVGTLNMSENRLRGPGNLQHFPNAHTLILDKNNLAGLQGFHRSDVVRQLWFNNNEAEDLAEFCDQVLETYPNVTWLSCMRNPCSPPLVCASEDDAATAERYRLYVIYRLPRLTVLDAQPVTAKERAEAALKGQFMAARKPRPGTLGSAPNSRTTSGTLFGMLGASGGSGTSATLASSAPQPAKKPTAFLAVGRQEYNGKNSEGNRFIVDKDL